MKLAEQPTPILNPAEAIALLPDSDTIDVMFPGGAVKVWPRERLLAAILTAPLLTPAEETCARMGLGLAVMVRGKMLFVETRPIPLTTATGPTFDIRFTTKN